MRTTTSPLSVCILGRQPALGLAELESLYGSHTVSPVADHAAGLSLHASDVDFDRLGGSTRLAHVLAALPTTDWKRIERELPLLVTELTLTLPPDGKIQLGLSAFGIKVSPAKLNASGLTLKKIIRSKTGRSVRVSPNATLELNTATVQHNKLAGPTGIELLLIATHDGGTIIARTVQVQDIDSYTLRDRGRPKRDARVGMLPPKLAQILINLTNPQPNTVVLDPFCGTGVLLQEALLMGLSVYGSDLEPRMIEYSRANLDWLDEQFGLADRHIFLEQADATTLENHDVIDAVACETYLGRPFTARPSPDILAQTSSDVNLILKKFLRHLHGQLASGTRLALAVPAWQVGPGQFKHLPLIDQISDLGYNRLRFEHVRDDQLLYYRDDQIVAREILALTRK
ncbi:MAG TPA: methyltransferase domain-containing protein [Candidatus Saccharimonadales bacterium]|nr:methyltransferase domain-containing protein [Candidatus Saccharimonadales bacterium]